MNRILSTIQELSKRDEEELREAYAVAFDVNSHAQQSSVAQTRVTLVMEIMARLIQLWELDN